jgi:chromosome partitioning protein
MYKFKKILKSKTFLYGKRDIISERYLMKVITITNQKGGVGKTVLSALLAYGLLKVGKRPLLMDLDPQAHLTSFFIKSNELDAHQGSLHLARGERFEIVSINVSKDNKIGLIPSRLTYMIDAFRGQLPLQDMYAVDKRLRTEPAINKNYDYVICDTPPELFAPTVWALYAADIIIIPINNEELSILGAKMLIQHILPSVFPYKKDLKVLGLVLTNITYRWKIDTIKRLNEKITNFIKNQSLAFKPYYYKDPLFNTTIHRENELKDLPYRPKRWETPLFRIMDRTPELNEEVVNFAHEVLQREQNFYPLQ